MDSGASRHMTGNKNFFKDLKPTTGLSVTLADGEKAEVAGIGGGPLVAFNGHGDTTDITMPDALYVPKLTRGLSRRVSLPVSAYTMGPCTSCVHRNRC